MTYIFILNVKLAIAKSHYLCKYTYYYNFNVIRAKYVIQCNGTQMEFILRVLNYLNVLQPLTLLTWYRREGNNRRLILCNHYHHKY